MLRKSKRWLATLCTVLLCISLFGGIILPEVQIDEATAEAAWAINAEAYQAVTDTATAVYDTDGTTVLGYRPAANVYFLDTSFSGTDGVETTYTYGGTDKKWGNGVTYYVTPGTNMFTTYATLFAVVQAQNATWAADTTAASGEAILMFAPGTVNSTGEANAKTFSLPSDVTDPTPEQLFKLTFLGPQAGQRPVYNDNVGALRDEDKVLTVQNSRSNSTSTEWTFASTLWCAKYCNSSYDGFAGSAGLKIYNCYNYIKASFVNFFADCSGSNSSGNCNDFAMGGNDINAIVSFEDCYFNHSYQWFQGKNGHIYSNDLTFNNCVFTGGKVAKADSDTVAAENSHALQLRCTAASSASSNFYGEEKAASPTWNFTNNAYVNTVNDIGLWLHPEATLDYQTYSDHAIRFNFKDNFVSDIGSCNDSKASFIYVTAITTVAQAASFGMDISGNHVQYTDEFAESKTATYQFLDFNGSDSVLESDKSVDIVYDIDVYDNVFMGDYSKSQYRMFNSMAEGVDVSGNLFMDNQRNVKPMISSYNASNYSANFTVQSDIYASSAMVGGIRELFTPTGVKGGVLCYSYIQLRQTAYADPYDHIKGAITVILQDGKTYSTADLFEYNDNIEYIGMYADEACSTPVTSVTQDTVAGKYARFRYIYGSDSSKTTCTVVFYVGVPTTYRVVDPDGKYTDTGYTFNGITFYADGTTSKDGISTGVLSSTDSDGNTTTSFYPAIYGSAYSGIANPSIAHQTDSSKYNMDTIILCAPGNYDETTTQSMGKSVCIVGPQAFDSPYSRTAALQGTTANGACLDTTKEAVLHHALNAAADGSYNYSFYGLSFAGTASLTQSTSKYNTQWQTIIARNCYFAVTGKDNAMGAMGRDWSDEGILKLVYDNCVFNGEGITYTGDGNLLDARSNFFDFTNNGIINSDTYSTARRVIYHSLTDGANLRCKPLDVYINLDNNTIYNSKREFAILAYRSNASDGSKHITNNPNLTYYPNGLRINATDNYMKDMKASCYMLSVCSPDKENNGSASFIDLTVTGNKMYCEDFGSTILTNYSPHSELLPIYKSATVKNNVFANKTNAFESFNDNMANNKEIDVNTNFFGTYSEATGIYTPVALGSSTGVSKTAKTYYLDADLNYTTDDIALRQGGFNSASITSSTFSDYKMTLGATKGQSYDLSDFVVNTSICSLVGVYTDAACSSSVEEGYTFTGDDTLYARVDYKGYVVTWTLTLTADTVWTDYGLDYADGETVVDIATQAKYAARTGGNAYQIVFVAVDWSDFAYTDVACTTAKTSFATGDVFYAKMPTTGIIYKLAYNVTASNVMTTNTALFGTIVFFPGTYNVGTGYNSGGGVAFPENTSKLNSYVAVGVNYGGNTYDDHLEGCTEFRLLGPYAGIAGGNTATGANTRTYNNASTAAVMATDSQFYLMNRTLAEGCEVIIDGINGGWGFSLGTAAGSGAANFNSVRKEVIYTIRNCVFGSIYPNDNGFFRFRSYNSTVDNSTSTAKNAKAHVTLNIEDSYVAFAETDSDAPMGLVNLDNIYINNTVIKRPVKTSAMPIIAQKGFLINPVNCTANTDSYSLNYSLKNSYVQSPGGYFFGVAYASTDLSSNRTAINVTFDNNKFVNSFLSTSDGSSTAYVAFSSSETITKLTNLKFTNNEVTNDTGAYPSNGLILVGNRNATYKGVTITGNVIQGYNNVFRGLNYPNATENVYMDLNGKVVSGKFAEDTDGPSCKYTDIVLDTDFMHRASHFEVTGGARMTSELTWTPGKLDITGTLSHAWFDGITADSVEAGITFACDDVIVLDLYEANGSTKATTLTAGGTYKLVVAESSDPAYLKATYTLTMDPDTVATPEWSDTKYYWDPDVIALGDGTKIVREVDGTEYIFTVGVNIYAEPKEMPITGDNKIYVYTFAKEYTGDYGVGGTANERDRHYYIYGAKHGVTPVTFDSDGLPTETMASDRTNLEEETIFNDLTLMCGFQSSVSIDGVTFANEVKVDDNSGSVSGTCTTMNLYNVSTDMSRPILQTASSGQILNLKRDNESTSVLDNNYLVMSEDSIGHMIVARHISDITMTNNYLNNLGTTGVLYSASSNYAGTSVKSDTFGITATNNNMTGHIFVEQLIGVDAINIDISGNLMRINKQHTITFHNISTMDYAGANINITDNTFETRAGVEDAWDYVFFGKDIPEGSDDFATLNVSGNTFVNPSDTDLKYAVNNESNFVLDVSGNTFVDFLYNYGYYEYTMGSATVDNGYDGRNVIFSNADESANASFVMSDGTYDANVDNSAGWAVSDAPASGHKVADTEAKTIIDIAPGADVYKFQPGMGMMVYITKDDGTDCYNVIELSGDVTTFTAQICKINGEPLGDTYSVTVYSAPISVQMNTANCKVEAAENAPNADKPYSTYWEGQVVPVNGTDIGTLLTQANFKVVDYGMYYGTSADAVTDIAINTEGNYVEKGGVTNSKTVAVYTKDGKTIGQKESYMNNADGLSQVYLIYSLRFSYVGCEKTRFGRMYLTYQVGDTLYTVLSDSYSLTTPTASIE